MVGMMVKNYQWLKKKVMGFPMAGMIVRDLYCWDGTGCATKHDNSKTT